MSVAAIVSPIQKAPKSNSFKTAAPIAVTLNMLWRHTRQALKPGIAKMLSPDLQQRVGTLHEQVLALDRTLKNATRFQPVTARKQLKEICHSILAELPAEPTGADKPVYIEFIHPIRQIADDRLQRFA